MVSKFYLNKMLIYFEIRFNISTLYECLSRLRLFITNELQGKLFKYSCNLIFKLYNVVTEVDEHIAEIQKTPIKIKWLQF